MPYIVVGRNESMVSANQRYRGTYREWLPHADHLPETAEHNRLFQTYSERAGESGVVDDLALARRVLASTRESLNRADFEIIRVEKADGSVKSDGAFLGYDLSMGFGYSLLVWGLASFHHADGSLPKHIRVLADLVGDHFRPLLNENGLFSEKAVAHQCLDCMEALQTLSPGFWEGGEWCFEVVEVFAIEAAGT